MMGGVALRGPINGEILCIIPEGCAGKIGRYDEGGGVAAQCVRGQRESRPTEGVKTGLWYGMRLFA